jgi:hypothetical protein
MGVDWQDSYSSLGQRDIDVLDIIGQEDLSGFTFEGLKRRLRAHPETLSRILDRLESQGIVEKGSDGYKVSPSVKSYLISHSSNAEEPHVPILQTLVSSDISPRQIAVSLKGKWFGMLRWLGYSENEEGITLKWVTEDGGIQIDAVFFEGRMSIEAKLLREKDLNVALRVAYQLVGYISKFYSGACQIRRVSYSASFDQPYFMLA